MFRVGALLGLGVLALSLIGCSAAPAATKPPQSISAAAEKRGAAHRFVVVDAAMNDLVRPALYEAWHGILPVSPVALVAPLSPAEVVGPVCETGDTFARGRALPAMEPGALVAFLDTGAYGSVMSSTYNARPLAAEVLVDGHRFAVVRDRQGYEALLAGQRVAPWLESPA